MLLLEDGLNIPRMILRWGGVRVLLPCLIFYNFTNLPADPCRSMYPAISWHYSVILCCNRVGLLVLTGYDTTTTIHCHSPTRNTNSLHFAHVFGSLSRSQRYRMVIFTTEEEIVAKKISLTEGIDTSKLHSSRRHDLLQCDCNWETSLGDTDNCTRMSTAVIDTVASDIENMSVTCITNISECIQITRIFKECLIIYP